MKKKKKKTSANVSFYFSSKRLHPLRATSKKNKKGLASVILATNSPNSELVVPILTETIRFVNKKMKKNEKTTNYQKTLEKRC